MVNSIERKLDWSHVGPPPYKPSGSPYRVCERSQGTIFQGMGTLEPTDPLFAAPSRRETGDSGFQNGIDKRAFEIPQNNPQSSGSNGLSAGIPIAPFERIPPRSPVQNSY